MCILNGLDNVGRHCVTRGSLALGVICLYLIFFLSLSLSSLIFEILPMLIDCGILQMGNTVEMAGGDVHRLVFNLLFGDQVEVEVPT